MKKKIAAIVMAVSAVATLVGCGKADINPADYVVLPDYRSFELDVNVAKAYTEEEIDAYMERDLDSYIEANGIRQSELITDRTDVQEGDIVNIDFEGLLDGVAFEGGTAEAYELKIGTNRFIPGFEAGLVGKNVGEEIELPLTFPIDYSPDLAGQDVIFKVKINSIAKEIPWPRDDTLMEKLQFGVTMEEYKTYFHTYVNSENENFTLTNISTAIWDTITEQSVIEEVPPQLIEDIKKDNVSAFRNEAKQNGMTEEEYLVYNQHTKESFSAMLDFNAELAAKQLLVIRAVAQAEGIEVTDEEIKEASESEAAASGVSASEYISSVFMNEENYRLSKLKEKVTLYLLDVIKINEIEVPNTSLFPQ